MVRPGLEVVPVVLERAKLHPGLNPGQVLVGKLMYRDTRGLAILGCRTSEPVKLPLGLGPRLTQVNLPA